MRIGILGGTFNPVHLGHLVMAQEARQKFKLDKVLFIPCAIPPHKTGRNLPNPQVRFNLVQRAIAGNPAFEASDLEIRRGGKSYSYDTLRQLHRIWGKDRFFFLVGADSLEYILSWHKIRDLMKLCDFIVVERPGFAAESLLRKMKPQDRRFFGKYLLVHSQIEISSRQIRERIKKGFSIRYLVPESVEVYLTQCGLYRC